MFPNAAAPSRSDRRALDGDSWGVADGGFVVPPPQPKKKPEPEPGPELELGPELEPEPMPGPVPEPELDPAAAQSQSQSQSDESRTPPQSTSNTPSVPESPPRGDRPAPELESSTTSDASGDDRVESSASLRISGSWRERAKDLLPVEHPSGDANVTTALLPPVAAASSPGQAVLTEMSLNNSLLDSAPTHRPETTPAPSSSLRLGERAPSPGANCGSSRSSRASPNPCFGDTETRDTFSEC